MADEIKKFLFDSLSHMENSKTESEDPYKAKLSIGNSSLSFGRMQNDVANNPNIAQTTFNQIMDNSVGKIEGLTQEKADTIKELAAIKGGVRTEKQTKELRGYFEEYVNPALSSREDISAENPGVSNQTLVDQADAANFEIAYDKIQPVIDAAHKNPNGPGELNRKAPNPEFLTTLIEWGNQTSGKMTETAKYMRETENVSLKDYHDNYLLQQTFYLKNPKVANNIPDRVSAATQYSLSKNSMTYTLLAADDKKGITVTPDQINAVGTNNLAIYNNANNKQVGGLWTFSQPATPETAGNLNINNSGTTLQPFERGRWSNFNVAPDGKATYTPTNNIATNGIYTGEFQKGSTYSFLQDPALSSLSSQLQSSGFKLQQEQTSQRTDQTELIKNLQLQMKESGLAVNKGDNYVPPDARGIQQHQAQSKGQGI